MKVSILARKDKRDAAGSFPLFVRIAHRAVVRDVSLDLRVKKRDWNDKAREIRKSHPNHAKLNRYLTRVENDVHRIIADLLSTGDEVNPKEVQLRLKSSLDREQGTGADFLSYCDSLVEHHRSRGRPSTAKAYHSQVQKLRAYTSKRLRRKDLPFSKIDVAFIRGFHTYLADEVGNGVNTQHKALSTVRTFLRTAMKDGLFPFDKDPFRHIAFRRERTRKEKLTLGEIQAIESLTVGPSSLLARVRDWFLFSFYSLGARFSDVATIQWKHIRREAGDTYLIYRMQKTRMGHSVLLPLQAVTILTRYENRSINPDCFVFDILDGYDVSTPAKLRSAIESRNALANKYLLKIARQAGIQRRISFHLARHSIADHMRKSGMSVYDIKSTLGHTQITTTEQYLRGFDRDDLAEKIRRLF